MTYHDRTGTDPHQGSAIAVRTCNGEVTLELGVMRNFGSISADAWAALSPAEARGVALALRVLLCIILGVLEEQHVACDHDKCCNANTQADHIEYHFEKLRHRNAPVASSANLGSFTLIMPGHRRLQGSSGVMLGLMHEVRHG
ncbi:hypothetical protein [Methylobacterium soli]|uniref:hypothetical protein n=1 Tax=Methylobacterium soli TaxID=553447 RepID=UPI001EE35BF0|nr:hypothetical protein [Methylobacterium soli]GJE44861.1 hypothetical protein AEGHOMDF_4052 [Methylobacterium soli]